MSEPHLDCVTPIDRRDLTPAAPGREPQVVWVSVRDLRIDRGYQRALGPASLKLIRRMVEQWDWSLCGPVVVAELPGGLYEVIDGQHRATAAVTHGNIWRLPAIIIPAETRADRARVFVALNSQRVAVSAMAAHKAAVAAGSAEAVALHRAAEASGIRILPYPPSGGKFAHGETVAIGALQTVLRRHGERALAGVLHVCAAARLAPVRAEHIGALAELLTGEEFTPAPPTERLAAALHEDWEYVLDEADADYLDHGAPRPRGRALALWRRVR